MCIDGNDKRGIDVGLLSKFPLRGMRTNIYDPIEENRNIAKERRLK
jgi:hypothetical protein